MTFYEIINISGLIENSLNARESSGSHLRARQAERRDNHRASRRVQLHETEEGHYELVMLGMRRAGRCRMKSQIEVLTVLGTEDPSFRFSEKVLSAINEWSRSSLKVTLKVLTGDPARVIPEIAPIYGLIMRPLHNPFSLLYMNFLTHARACSLNPKNSA